MVAFNEKRQSKQAKIFITINVGESVYNLNYKLALHQFKHIVRGKDFNQLTIDDFALFFHAKMLKQLLLEQKKDIDFSIIDILIERAILKNS